MTTREPETAAPPGTLRVRGLTRRFGERTALAPLDLDVGPGGITGLLGPNGSGKSTLLRCLVGLVRPDAGEVWVDGVRLAGDGLAVRRRVTYSPGELACYGGLRADAHLAWLLDGRGREALRRARELCEAFELPLAKRMRTFSHGMKRQLFFAAALAPRVRVRLLDEITEGLDPTKRGAVHELLRADAAAGTTILLSSHHLGEVQRVCDRMVFVRDGRLVSDEAAAAVRRHSRELLRVGYEPGADLAPVAAAARRAGALEAREHGGRLTLRLAGDDPRAVLAALCADPALPRPRRVEYGELSLEDLFGELYGEEAC
ncbi:MAG: ABC transporter ATP-binding protein [Planctomycetes bacterium]|nr:ABC transporter ATP-binding protein [Planctomycetota bacterium]